MTCGLRDAIDTRPSDTRPAQGVVIVALCGIRATHRKSVVRAGAGDRRNQRQGGGSAAGELGQAAPGNRDRALERGKSAHVSNIQAPERQAEQLKTLTDGVGAGLALRQGEGGAGEAPLYVYRWGGAGRKGALCQVTARGSRNSRRIRFADGMSMITLGNALRKARPEDFNRGTPP